MTPGLEPTALAASPSPSRRAELLIAAALILSFVGVLVWFDRVDFFHRHFFDDGAIVIAAMAAAAAGGAAWNATPAEARAAALMRAGDALEAQRGKLIALLQVEGGKTLDDAVAEVREAADFCRYYATQIKEALSAQALPGPTGESNVLSYRGRGVFVCISPWNFPLAIFTGQVAAALAAGNAVVAKPAEQTPLVAAEAVRLLHAAGAKTGLPVLYNTSFNLFGEPLVCTPRDAVRSFYSSGIDAMFVGNFFLQK